MRAVQNLTSNNSANTINNTFAGGVVVDSGTVNVRNTIIAGNTNITNPDVSGTFVSQGYNLIGNTTGSTGFSAASNDILNPAGGASLGALANNGGQTDTHALLPGSRAIDKGAAATDPATSLAITTDQRGLTRPSDNTSIPPAPGGNNSDIGAFEVQSLPTAASVSVGGRAVTSSGRGIRNVVIRMTDTNGNVRTATTTSFGYYRFADVAAGETYIITATGKRFTFSQPSRVLNIVEDTEDVNFIANDVNNLFSRSR